MARLKEVYNKELKQKLKQELGLKNDMEVPVIKKVVLNMGIGDAVNDNKILKTAQEEMTLIAGKKLF